MRPPRPSSMVEIACQSARHFRFFFGVKLWIFFAYFGSQKVPRTAACNSRHFSGFKLGIRPSKVALRVPVSTNGLMSETFISEAILEVHLRWSIGERCTNMCCIK